MSEITSIQEGAEAAAKNAEGAPATFPGAAAIESGVKPALKVSPRNSADAFKAPLSAPKAAKAKAAVVKPADADSGTAGSAAASVAPAAGKSVKSSGKATGKSSGKSSGKVAATPTEAEPAESKTAAVAASVKAQSKAKAPAKPHAADAAAKVKPRKAKLVRDSFSMPDQEYAMLLQVKKECLKNGFAVKKSELLRIGVGLISQIDMALLQSMLLALPKLMTGRPKKQ